MFSKTTEYALRAVIYIAQESSVNNKLGLNEIAKAIGSPPSFTAKILQRLTAGDKLVSSLRGPNGGFYLSEKSKTLPVRKILEAMNEDEVLDKCILGLAKCSETNPCPMHSKYKTIKEQLVQLFETKTIQHLADDMNKGKVFVNNKRK